MKRADESFQLTSPTSRFETGEKAGLGLVGIGLLALLVAIAGAGTAYPWLLMVLSLGSITVGALLYFRRYLRRPAGINNDGLMFSSATARGALGWVMAVVFTGFYVLIYWFPSTLQGLIDMFDPFSQWMRGQAADQWFTYGIFYTMAVLVMGVRAIYKYRHRRLQIVRTLSVTFFQLGFAFVIPQLLILFNQPEFYFHYFWPLQYNYLFPSTVDFFADQSRLGVFMILWGAVLTFIATPVLTYFFGKRWYCSWVCGCGGLAETAGDPFRHLSDKSLKAWRVERWLVHGILVIITVGTAVLWINSATEGAVLGGFSGWFAQAYGFYIGGIFSGVIGVGFYPLMGSRVWCRFGCPMAAILGLLQKYFSRFRITTNGGQCISCGNCSTYCEMGIDVEWYAQRGQNVIRAACVGCGACTDVCPRGVLKMENGPMENRYNGPILIHEDHVSVQLDESWKESRPTMPSHDEDIPVFDDEDWNEMYGSPQE